MVGRPQLTLPARRSSGEGGSEVEWVGAGLSARRGLRALPFLRLPVRERLRYAGNVDLPVRQKLPHTIPQWVAEGSWFFISINCVPRGKNQLCRSDTGNAVLAAVKFNHEKFVWHCRLC